MITEKLLNKFLLFLYQWHIEEYGESISTLSNGGVDALDRLFQNEYPEAIAGLSKDTTKDLTYNLAKELDARGLAKYDGLIVTLTRNGFTRAKQLNHPFKNFFHAHWKWVVGAVLTFITILLAITRLMKCP